MDQHEWSELVIAVMPSELVITVMPSEGHALSVGHFL